MCFATYIELTNQRMTKVAGTLRGQGIRRVHGFPKVSMVLECGRAPPDFHVSWISQPHGIWHHMAPTYHTMELLHQIELRESCRNVVGTRDLQASSVFFHILVVGLGKSVKAIKRPANDSSRTMVFPSWEQTGVSKSTKVSHI